MFFMVALSSEMTRCMLILLSQKYQETKRRQMIFRSSVKWRAKIEQVNSIAVAALRGVRVAVIGSVGRETGVTRAGSSSTREGGGLHDVM